jgi:DNA-binding CsgD family transcriptional regulator
MGDMSSLLYPGRRLLLAVAPEQAPEAVKLIGMLLYIAAPAGLVAAAMAILFAQRSVRERIHRPILWILGSAVAGLVLYSIRYWVSAYHRESLLLLNNLAVHTVYLVLFAFNLSLFRLWDHLPERFTRRYFRYLQAAGLYLYLVGYAAFLVSTVNVFARVIELGFLLVIVPALSQLLLGLRMPHGVPSLQEGARSPEVAPVRRFGGFATEGPKTPGSIPKREAQDVRQAFFERTVDYFGITTRERAVLEMVMQGKNNAAIAEALGISEKTVRNHISNLYHKTDTANRVELVQTFEVMV